jgi:hypothetical protein
VEVEWAAADGLPGEVVSRVQRAAVKQAVGEELEVEPVRGQRNSEPAEPASGFRGTITEAIKEAEKRGVVAFTLAERREDERPRIETPSDLARIVERVREHIAPEAKDVKAYTVREDGTIHNTITHRDEYAPVHPDVARRLVSDVRAEREGPREGPAPGARASKEHVQDEPAVSVSMS